jgi:Zn-dependent peptidase ImmA (M78 family)
MVHRRPDGVAIIGVNSAHSIGRQRFTIAHELGHLILHKDETLHVDERAPIGFRNEESSLATKDVEIEANQFAAELLMPADLLAKEIESISDDLEAEAAVSELADRFQVSEQAMTLRLTRLGILA